MALSDPQSITINTVANSLPRVAVNGQSSKYSKDDGTVILNVAHSNGKRTRRQVRVEHSKIAPDPLISSTNIKHSMSAYLVVDVPVTGYTVTEQKQIVDGLIAWLSATSGANLAKVLGGES